MKSIQLTEGIPMKKSLSYYRIFTIALGLSAAQASAATVVQTTTDYLAFEAELAETFSNMSIIDAGTAVTAPVGASGGSGVWAHGLTQGVADTPDAAAGVDTVTYTINFSQAGDYQLYGRSYIGSFDDIGESGKSGSNDSVWVPNELGTEGAYTGSYTRSNFYGDTGALEWANEASTTYSVLADVDYTFSFSNREDGKFLDRFAFVLVGSSIDTSQAGLDALTNSVTAIPEPSTWALISLSCVSLLIVKRKLSSKGAK